MSETISKESNQDDLVEYTAEALGVSPERARQIVAIHHPNIVQVQVEEIQELEPEEEK